MDAIESEDACTEMTSQTDKVMEDQIKQLVEELKTWRGDVKQAHEAHVKDIKEVYERRIKDLKEMQQSHGKEIQALHESHGKEMRTLRESHGKELKKLCEQLRKSKPIAKKIQNQ